jgi:hypothetical protein
METVPRMVVYGEGAVAPVFQGVFYFQNAGETKQQAAWRFNTAMSKMGFEWMEDVRNP